MPAAAPPVRLDRPAPPLALTDQHGQTVDITGFRGRVVFVTFAFGHCETVCPLVVKNALAGARAVAEPPVVLVVTVDPWRDTPSRLPDLAQRWELERDGYALSGEVETVGRVLDDWDVRRSRNMNDGSIVHGALTYVVDRDGRVAFATSGSEGALVEAVAAL